MRSTRLPGKPLVDLAGKPMIVRTFERCASVFAPEDIRVATDSEEVASVCRAAGIRTIMTREDHMTGTDRVAEVAQIEPADIYINVQGDEPLFAPEDLKLLHAAAIAAPDLIHNGYCSIRSAAEHQSPTVPKVVFDRDQFLLYMSRAAIPGSKDGGFTFAYRQVCAYAFPASALDLLTKNPAKTPLEEPEDIEILRFLELGLKVKMVEMSERSIPVDHPEDVEKAIAALREAGLT